MSDLVHGWRVTYYLHPSDDAPPTQQKSAVRLSKGSEWVVTMGNPGIDRSILLERAIIAALEKDLDAAKTDVERDKTKERLRRARLEERISMAERLEARERE